jgi:ATP-binding cassette subfamily G (WHITE) protein 2
MKNTKIISVTWEKVSASIHGKDIIRNCSGYCKSGEMVAIMGPSGAGKTTLLSLLSKRQSSSMYIEGEVKMRVMQVLANNESFDSKMFFKFGAFVYQNDLLFECLTVQCFFSST